ncbi:MAG: RluA family pseudouridine synthase [Calditrichaeota bacterium]|nr:MAG: RluA family pseudouridine synthase [Calditrichota bacterium]
MQPAKKSEIKIDTIISDTRIDRFISSHFPDLSRSSIQKLIQKGLVTVNGKPVKPSYHPVPGDHIEITIPEKPPSELTPENIPLKILYEDPHLIVVDKPASMVVHPGAGVKEGTLVNALLAHCDKLSSIGSPTRPGIVHRLDKNTSGVIVVAKDDATHLALQEQFANKAVQRFYQALVWGKVEPSEGILDTFINRSKSDRKKFVVAQQGKPAVTRYQVLQQFSFLTLVKVQLFTGRTHQIRVHFKHFHHPVFGDPEYSGRKKQLNRLSSLSERKIALYWLNLIQRQALHAYYLGFIHPALGRWMEFESPLPEDFANLLVEIQKYEESL